MADLGEWRCRSGKIPHKTRGAASDQLRTLKHTRRGKGMHVYKCDDCGCWHVGHPKGMKWKRKIVRHGNPGEQLPKCS